MLDAFVLSAWAAGVFMAPLLTALPPYRRATWWLWPALRVLWQLGGGLLAGIATARMIGASEQGLWLGGAILGSVGALLCIAPIAAMVRGPVRLEGDLFGLHGETRTAFVPPARAQRIDRIELELRTDDGPVRLRFRGMQGSHVVEQLAAFRPGAHVQLWLLAPLRALVHVEAAR